MAQTATEHAAEAVSERLTESMKAASKEIHSISDAAINARLVGLFGNRQLYGQAISCFYWIFKELEGQLSTCWAADKRLAALKPVVLPLFRTSAFEQDLSFYLGADWLSQVSPMPEVQAYQQHLRALGASSPLLLLAHSYTQHMALLSGGQIIKRLARKGMQLPQGQGVAIYEYTGSTVSELKRDFKGALDDLAREGKLNEAELKGLEQEHVQAFKFNNAIIRAFRMGWWRGSLAVARATLALTPLRYWLGLLGLGAALMAVRMLQPK